jgi:hypothetical protein
MGSFYTNVTLRGPDQDAVAEYLAGRNRQVLVSPTVQGVTVVYDALTESQDPRMLTNLGRELSAQFDCPALAALNHDDDVLWLQLHVDGRLVDEYTSEPGYFDPAEAGGPEGGDAEALCEAFGAEEAVAKVRRVLGEERDAAGFVFASKRHTEVAEALGMPPELVTTGYRYLTHGETPEGFQPHDLIHTGPVPQTATMSAQGPWGPQTGPQPPPGAPGGGQPGAPEGGRIHIGPAPGAGCCGCLLAPILVPLGLLLSAYSAWVLGRQAEQMRGGQPPPE